LKKETKKTQGRKPLCIIGTATTCKDAPYDMKIDDEYVYDIWGISATANMEQVKRLDVAFEMHPKRYWGQQMVMERLKEFPGRMIMQDHYNEIPNSEAYPRETIKDKYYLDAMGDNLFVTNTMVWIILQALEEGYTDISLYGVHMAHETEYAYQRSSMSWVLGIIHGWILDGKDYKIWLPEESQILRAEYEYGFDEPTKAMQYCQGRMSGMAKGIIEAQEKIKGLEISMYRTEGAQSEAKHMHDKLAGWG